MPFLNLDKKSYVVGDIEFPVKEDIKGSELKPLRDMQRDLIKKEREGKELTDLDQLDYELRFFDEVSLVAFGYNYEGLLEKISEPDARALLGEAYIFLTKLGTIERAKQLDGVLAEIESKSRKLSKDTQNLKSSSQSSDVSKQE